MDSTRSSIPSSTHCLDVWGTSSSHVFVVGGDGVILYRGSYSDAAVQAAIPKMFAAAPETAGAVLEPPRDWA